MELAAFLLTALVSTALFTLAGLIMSWIRNKETLAPVILKKFLERLGVSEYGACEQILAFSIRYSISLIAILLYELADTRNNHSVLSPKIVFLSVLFGIAGIVVMRFIGTLLSEVKIAEPGYSRALEKRKKIHTTT